MTMATYQCCNEACGWSGPLEQTVTPKHVPEQLLCPACYEVVEASPVPTVILDYLPSPYKQSRWLQVSDPIIPELDRIFRVAGIKIEWRELPDPAVAPQQYEELREALVAIHVAVGLSYEYGVVSPVEGLKRAAAALQRRKDFL